MKKKSNHIEKAKANRAKQEVVAECCKNIFYAFESPGNCSSVVEGPEPSVVIDQIAPWQHVVKSDEDFDKLYQAIQVSFAMGYAIGQMLDVPEVDPTPIQDLLREKKTLLYFPHKKKAA